ncbi:ABC transporter permease [Bacteroidota bacterium]
MIKNFIKIALRNLLKHKFYSLLNVAGLAVGMAVCLLIILFVQDELSYDTYHENSDRIYRVVNKGSLGGQNFDFTYCPAPLGPTFVEDYPEVETATRLRYTGNFMIKYGDKNLKEEKFVFSDTEIFDVFSFNLIKGNPKTALAEPHTLVITEKIARKYFGIENPIGKTVIVDNETPYIITGVFEEMPSNTHFNYELLASASSLEDSRSTMWLNQNWQTYILLREGAAPVQLESKFPGFLDKYFGPQLQQFMGINMTQFREQGNDYIMYLQPVTDIHLYSDLSGELGVNSDIKYVYIFSAIAIFILLIACVNFMNLSTARSAGRAKEVGIRKVLGSFKKQLVYQFLTESIILSITALLLAILVAYLTLPYFNNLAGKEMVLSVFGNPWIFLAILLITSFVGLLAGSYPAFFISAFQPVDVLKGKIKSGAKSGLLRSALVVFQFSASIFLIIGTTVVFNQLNFIQQKKLGFNKEHVILINDAWLIGDQTFSFRDELKNNSNVINATASGFLPVPSNTSSSIIFPDANMNSEYATSIQNWRVDFNYVETLGLEIVKGRDFSNEFATDSMAVIINEAAVKQFNLGDDPIGKILARPSNEEGELDNYTLIGVVKDFHFQSLRQNIAPVALFPGNSTSIVSVRFKSADIAQMIEFIEQKWNEFAPGQPFDYTFLDEEFNNMYKAEQSLGNIFTIFAGLAIFVGCLGLLGLAAFTAEQRTKEIGVRKVLGATVPGVVVLLSKEFGKLIIISFVIAVPLAYYAMTTWLEDFAYRTDIGIYTFIFAGLLAFVIALATVSYHAIKVALANPVNSLRYE